MSNATDNAMSSRAKSRIAAGEAGIGRSVPPAGWPKRTIGNPMRTISVRNLAAHKVRLLLTLVSVMLGTAFVAGSLVFTDSLQRSFDSIFTTAYQNVDTRVAPRHDYGTGVSADLAGEIAAIPGVRTVQPELDAPVVLVDAHGRKVSPGGAPSEAGIWTPAAQTLGEVPTFVAGHAPGAAGEVVVNEGAAERGNLKVGQRISVVAPRAGVVHVRLAGIYHTDTATGGYIGVLFTQRQAMSLFTDGTHLSALEVSATSGVSEQALTARIAKILPDDLQAKTGTAVRADAKGDVRTALSFVNYLLLGFGIIALLVGTFIIYNTFSMIVAQRLRELALLRAIGADRKQVRRSVLTEAGIVGAAGSLLGVGGGIGLAFVLYALLDALDLGLPSGGLVLSARTIIVTLVLGVAVTLASANAPARRAAKIPPVAAMREQFGAPSARGLRRRSIAGVTLAVIAALVTADGALTGSAGASAGLVGLGLLAAGAAAMLLSPALARVFIAPLGRVVGRPFGAVGELARTNAVRNPRRTAATAFALTVGLLLVSGIAVVGASMKASVNALVENSVTADYVLTTQSAVDVPPAAAAAAARVDGVGSMTTLHVVSAVLDGTHYDGLGVDGPLAPVLKLEVEHGAAQPAGHSLLISHKTATDRGWALGSTHILSVPGGGQVTETVTGIYADTQLLGPWLVSGEVYRALTPVDRRADIVALVKAAPGADLDALRVGLERATNSYYVVDVQTPDEFRGDVAAQVDGLLGLLYGLLGLAIVIAILGIINTLALSVVERRREIGMLRAVGMQRKQVRRAIYLESALIAVFGAVLGVGLGLGYGTLFARTLRGQGMDQLSVPWGQAVLFLALAAVVGLLAALWPGIRAARTRPLAAIAEG
jgi:putative ABC transport system permease protein